MSTLNLILIQWLNSSQDILNTQPRPNQTQKIMTSNTKLSRSPRNHNHYLRTLVLITFRTFVLIASRTFALLTFIILIVLRQLIILKTSSLVFFQTESMPTILIFNFIHILLLSSSSPPDMFILLCVMLLISSHFITDTTSKKPIEFHHRKSLIHSLLDPDLYGVPATLCADRVRFCQRHYDIIESILPQVIQITEKECKRITRDLKWSCSILKPFFEKSSFLGLYQF